MIYKLINNPISKQPATVMRFNEDGTVSSFIFDPANSDYANFKRAINEGVELQDAEGNVMTAEQAQAFVKELP